MFTALTEEEKQSFFSQTSDNFIPGYTGHCPTLKFHYGRCYGEKTKEILKDLRQKRFIQDPQRTKYREFDYSNPVLTPVVRSKGQFRDFALDYKNRAPPYITGYTGFIPTLNFRYGKSYSKAADDSRCDFTNKQRRIREAEEEVNRMFRARSAPRMSSIRCQDEVKQALYDYVERNKFQDHKISAEYPPIAGYTGHIPRVKGNEESLSQRYNTVVKRGLTLLREEQMKMNEVQATQNKICDILNEIEVK